MGAVNIARKQVLTGETLPKHVSGKIVGGEGIAAKRKSLGNAFVQDVECIRKNDHRLVGYCGEQIRQQTALGLLRCQGKEGFRE